MKKRGTSMDKYYTVEEIAKIFNTRKRFNDTLEKEN